MDFRIYNNLENAGNFLLTRTPGIAVFDLDYTLKSNYLKLLICLEFGKIPLDSVTLLQDMQKKGWVIAVVTNQPKSGHQIASVLGNIKNYPYFPKAIEDIIGKENIFGGGLDFISNHNKKTQRATVEVSNFILRNHRNITGGICVVGDKIEDYDFAERVNETLNINGLSIDTFIKLPDPVYLDYMPAIFAKLIP